MSQLILIDDSYAFCQFSSANRTAEPSMRDMLYLGAHSQQKFAPSSNDSNDPTVLDTLTNVRQDTSGMSINQGVVSMMQYHHYF